MKNEDLLLEIGTEELPPKALPMLSKALRDGLADGLQKAQLTFEKIEAFAAPRRLAVLVTDLVAQQPDLTIERRGPALAAAYDANGKHSKAAQGFAKSCQTSLDKITTLKTDKGEWLYYQQKQAGQKTIALIADIINNVIKQLPVPKLMRWGNHDTQFIRPVHWVVLLYGEHVINTKILGQETSNQTYGHRFHHPQAIPLDHANEYQRVLNKTGHVVVDFAERRSLIQTQVQDLATQQKVHAIIDSGLLAEVTGIVEWPQALIGTFDKKFLQLPKEVLVSVLHQHQKCFHVENSNGNGNVSPYFITVSNIRSKHPQQVIAGNERVVQARLSDAEFFYQRDKQQSLSQWLEHLKHVVYQDKLGSMYDKSLRIAELAKRIATNITEANAEHAYRAGLLCKTDLVSGMVGEFPELQGIMGYYYALHAGEPEAIANAIKQHYQPRFSGDELPASSDGSAVALADNIDTLVSIIETKGKPSGDKDPYALRRAAFSVIRIIIENKLKYIDLADFITNETVLEFIEDRLRAYYKEKGVATEIFLAVTANKLTNLCDLDQRIYAVQAFNKLPEAESLAEANKRVKNILEKNKISQLPNTIADNLLESDIEKQLLKAIKEKQAVTINDYEKQLKDLASLKPPVDNFFDNVMVMVDDEKIRNNRLAMLYQLRQLFLQVADISYLSK